MSEPIHEINSMQDAEQLAETILQSLHSEGPSFNPFKGSLVELTDGAILFNGETYQKDQVRGAVTDHLWKNRSRFNRQLKRWLATGGQVIDCGC